MENSSTSPPSPAWPTRWPQDAFKPLGILVVLSLIAGAFLLGQVLSIVVMLLMQPTLFNAIVHRMANASLLTPMTTIVASATAEIPILVAVLFALPRFLNVPLRSVGFVRPGLLAIGIALAGVPAAVLAGTVGSAIVGAVTHTGTHSQATEQMFLGLHVPWQIALFAIFAVGFAPIVEETVFRVFFFNAALRYGGFWTAAALSSIIFGLAHFDLYNALPLAMVGLVLGSVYYLTRNAYASMITHGLFNLLTLVALLFFPKVAG